MNQYGFDGLEQKIGYIYKDKKLLRQAMTHTSFANEQKMNKLKSYERIEFLGDAILEMVSRVFQHFYLLLFALDSFSSPTLHCHLWNQANFQLHFPMSYP